MEDVPSCCCFYQAVAGMLYIYNSVWLATPIARWSNSVLSMTFCPRRSAQGSTTTQLWVIYLSPHPNSAVFTFPAFVHSEFSFLSHPCSQGWVQHSIPPLLLVLDYNLLYMLFSFVGGHSICPKVVLDYILG
jgi:hypothetical protein